LRLQWTGRMTGGRSRAAALAVVAVLASAYAVWTIIGAGGEAALWGAVLLAMGAPVYFLVRAEGAPSAASEGSA
jgi:basic amino acid/polyamine antiporter, APA family